MHCLHTQLLNLSCLAKGAAWGVRRWGPFSGLSSPIPCFYGFYSPSLFPLTPTMLFLIYYELQQHPLPPFPPLSLASRPHTHHLSFLTLSFSHLNCWPCSSSLPPHHPLCLSSILANPFTQPSSYASSTFPWQNQGWESNDWLSLPSPDLQAPSCERELCPLNAFIASGGMSCCVRTGKDFGFDWNFGGHWEKVSELGP